MRQMKMEEIAQHAIKYIWSFVGTPYRWGGDDFSSWDCSGLAVEMLKCGGLMAEPDDATAQMLFDSFQGFEIGKPIHGALAFFGKTRTKIVHVGICIDEYLMIEAGGGGSKTLTVSDAIRQNAFVKVRPIRRRKDVVGFCDPFLQEI